MRAFSHWLRAALYPQHLPGAWGAGRVEVAGVVRRNVLWLSRR